MTWNSGPCLDVNAVIFLVLDYGEASYRHGQKIEQHKVAKQRDPEASPAEAEAAGRDAIRAFTELYQMIDQKRD